jgi:hypothetical protein
MFGVEFSKRLIEFLLPGFPLDGEFFFSKFNLFSLNLGCQETYIPFFTMIEIVINVYSEIEKKIFATNLLFY